MCREALDLERSNGGERTESKCRKEKDHDLWYLQSSVEFTWAVCCSGVGSNSIFCNGCSTGFTRNAVGSSTWQRILIIDLHGARKLHTPWTGDNIGKSKSKLTSWRWKLPFATKEICSQQPMAANLQPQCVKTAWKKFKELLPILFQEGQLSVSDERMCTILVNRLED